MVHIGKSKGNLYHLTFRDGRWTYKGQIPDQATTATPGLAAVGDGLALVYVRGERSELVISRFRGGTWTRPQRVPDMNSLGSPAIAAAGGLHLVYRDLRKDVLWHSKLAAPSKD